MALRKARLTRLSRHHDWTVSPSAASAQRAMLAQTSRGSVVGDGSWSLAGGDVAAIHRTLHGQSRGWICTKHRYSVDDAATASNPALTLMLFLLRRSSD